VSAEAPAVVPQRDAPRAAADAAGAAELLRAR